MAYEQWAEVVDGMRQLTLDGKLFWHTSRFKNSIREDVQGDGIYATVMENKTVIVYEYRYKSYTGGTDEWEWETDVAIEFVDFDGKLEWQWPKTPHHAQLLDAIRYVVAGGPSFLKDFLAKMKPPAAK